MKYNGLLCVDADPHQIPVHIRPIVKCSAHNPRPEIDVVVATSSNILEIKNGLIHRSCPMPDLAASPDRIQFFQGAKDWYYVLELEDSVVLYAGSSLQVTSSYTNVLSYKIGDFFDVQLSFLFIQFISNNDPVITDGSTEFKPAQPWPPPPESKKVQDVLDRRLKISKNALEKCREEVESTKEFINESIRHLAASCQHIQTVQEKSLKKLMNPSDAIDINPADNTIDLVKITDKHVRILSDEIILVLRLETSIDLDNFSVEYVSSTDTCVPSRSSLVIMRRREGRLYPEQVNRLRPEETGLGILILPLSLLAFSKQSIDLALNIRHKLGCSRVESLSLTSDLLMAGQPSLDPQVTSLASDRYLVDFLSFFLTGVRESLTVSTDMGSLANFEDVLISLGFTVSAPGYGNCFRDPSQLLHGTFIIHNLHSSQALTMDVYSASYASLATCVKLLRGILPCDTKFLAVNAYHS